MPISHLFPVAEAPLITVSDAHGAGHNYEHGAALTISCVPSVDISPLTMGDYELYINGVKDSDRTGDIVGEFTMDNVLASVQCLHAGGDVSDISEPWELHLSKHCPVHCPMVHFRSSVIISYHISTQYRE